MGMTLSHLPASPRAALGLRILPFGLLMLVLGCAGGSSATPELAPVSGKVTFKGKPLPGGRITFVALKGGQTGSGNIDEKGEYQIRAPVGDVSITVDNQMLSRN